MTKVMVWRATHFEHERNKIYCPWLSKRGTAESHLPPPPNLICGLFPVASTPMPSACHAVVCMSMSMPRRRSPPMPSACHAVVCMSMSLPSMRMTMPRALQIRHIRQVVQVCVPKELRVKVLTNTLWLGCFRSLLGHRRALRNSAGYCLYKLNRYSKKQSLRTQRTKIK